MTTQIERFTAASRTLADIRHVPAGRGLWQQQYGTGPGGRVTLGTMLAQVAIVPAAGGRCTLTAAGGDPEMLDALKARPDGQGILIEGELPFKPGSTGSAFGNVTVMGSVTIISGSGAVYSSSGSGPSVIIGGREVDLSRDVRLVLTVPATASIRIRGFTGAAGITGDLSGDLDFSPSFFAALAAPGSIRSLTADLSGSGRAVIGRVEDDTDLEISGSGDFSIGAACGAVAAKVSGSGSISVNGRTYRPRW
jgi:hypothetical protein